MTIKKKETKRIKRRTTINQPGNSNFVMPQATLSKEVAVEGYHQQ